MSGDCYEGIDREEIAHVTMEIKWGEKCLREGDSETSWDKLMR